jgi:hypothetical protein
MISQCINGWIFIAGQNLKRHSTETVGILSLRELLSREKNE